MTSLKLWPRHAFQQRILNEIRTLELEEVWNLILELAAIENMKMRYTSNTELYYPIPNGS